MKGCLAYHAEMGDSWDEFIGKQMLIHSADPQIKLVVLIYFYTSVSKSALNGI